MDVDGETSGALADMDDLENYAFDNESCGICRDIVINRGVLDCCQHWFCYTCIDNWAAITNRCPLCKSEFHRIACAPVYDTVGANNGDEHSLTSGDDDWYVQGESNTLSFPSYYIDAEAVVCLDDGDCMIRSGLVAAEDDSTFDTSIACDSCDRWYHAICVGFNPEMASEDSWLCPRCVSTEVKHKADVTMKQNFNGDCIISSGSTTSAGSFCGRVSVSIADEGETALVVSMVRDGLSEASPGLKTQQEAFTCNSRPSYSTDNLSHDATAHENVMTNTDGMVSSEQAERSLAFSPIRESAPDLFSTEQGNTSNEQLEAQHVPSDSSLHSSKGFEITEEENAVSRYNNDRSPVTKSPQLPSPCMPGSKTARSTDLGMINTDAAQQIISAQNTQLPLMHDGHNSSGMGEVKDMESGNEIRHPAKKAKLGMPDQEMHLIRNSSVSTDCHASSSAAKTIVSDTSEFAPQDKSVPDIMSIVGEDYKRDLGRELAKPVGRRAEEKPGLRVKKIFRKEDGKASSVVVQKLQQEIREVVRDSGISILEKDNAFDEKLLTAFRAAIGKSIDGPAKKTNPSIRTRSSLLQKGKIRENLTKKLYGTSMGRRRSAWHRDWEVEFWKYRCPPGVNPEKIETLQSVLQLLKKSSDSAMDKESVQEKKGVSTSSILSRVYLADASVVPRKDDIKPLSALAGSSTLDQNSQMNDNREPNKPAPGTERIKVNPTNSTGQASSSSILNKEASSRRENKNSQGAQNQPNQSAGDIKQDKRKWALEILARKNASSVTSKDQTEDTDDLKGHYPLLAQLPMDLRPQLTTGRHNKVPISVRKAQLYRIAEHYLQKANLDVIRRCADTELAMADAVNVEKDIYERSGSKSVYVNLCSQAARQPAKAKSEDDASTLTEKTELRSDQISQQVTTVNTNVGSHYVEETSSREGLFDPPISTEKIDKSDLGGDLPLEQTLNEHTVGFSNVEEALKKAGLFDSPPNSPDRKVTIIEGESSLSCIVGMDTEPGKSLQSTSDSPVLIDLDKANCQDSDTSCQQPKCNPDEHQKLMASKETTDAITFSVNLAETNRCSVRCEKSSTPDKEIVDDTSMPDEGTEYIGDSRKMDVEASDLHNQSRHVNHLLKEGEEGCRPNNLDSTKGNSSSDSPALNSKHSKGDKPTRQKSGDLSKKPQADPANNNTSDSSNSIYKKVEMFVKENIRPLCKSGVITVEQYRWAVAKTAEKVMRYHCDAKKANFLIKEGEKVKKLALQYVETAQQTIS